MKRDKLNQTIGARPSKSQLRQANVLPKHNVAAPLASKAIALEKAMKKDQLKNAFANRPTQKQLKAANVLPQHKVRNGDGLLCGVIGEGV